MRRDPGLRGPIRRTSHPLNRLIRKPGVPRIYFNPDPGWKLDLDLKAQITSCLITADMKYSEGTECVITIDMHSLCHYNRHEMYTKHLLCHHNRHEIYTKHSLCHSIDMKYTQTTLCVIQ